MEVDRLARACGTLGAGVIARQARLHLSVFCAVLFAMPWTLSAMAATCYVNGAASGANTGVSWTNAYTGLQSALTNANCTEVWVAHGVYKPVVPANVGSVTPTEQAVSFNIKPGVAVYGGFAGGETSRDARDPVAHVTILSGDIDNNDDNNNADGNFIDETSADIAGSNSRHIVQMDGTTGTPITASTVLDGFTLTGGDNNNDSVGGGALLCNGVSTGNVCSPTLARLSLFGNRAAYGGAMAFNGYNGGASNPTLTHVFFSGNKALNFGGAIHCNGQLAGASSPTLTDVTFSGNSSLTYGGAMVNNGATSGVSNPTFVNVTFSGNSATSLGGAIFNIGGGGNSSPTFFNATFNGNSAASGGAMYNSAPPSGGTSNPTLNNVILWGDSATSSGPEIAGSGDDGSETFVYYGIIQGDCPVGASCSNISTSDPMLGALANNGGFAPTIMPGSGGSAINAVPCYLTPYTDQRDAPRPDPASAGLAKACDLGAVEAGSVASDDIFADGFGALQYH